MGLVFIFNAIAAILVAANAQCLFNGTHCDCAVISGSPGLCTRYSSGTGASAICYVDNCQNDKYVCDCAGGEVCAIRACDSWKAANPADVTEVGDIVACSLQAGSATCVDPPVPQGAALSPTPSTTPSAAASSAPSASASSMPSASPSTSASSTPSGTPAASMSNTPSASPTASSSMAPSASMAPSTTPSAAPSASSSTTPSATPSNSPPASATPSTSPIPEYRMYQFGTASDETMFNMTFFTDTADFITSTYQMRNVWPQRTRYEQRWHTVLMFKNDAGNDYFLCYVINAYFNVADDGLGFMHTDVTVTGADGQMMRWVACDDASDSCLTPQGTVLTSYFGNAADVTDGFCVKPLDFSGNTIELQVTNVEGARGIRFIRPSGTVKEFLWADGATNGMTGTVDANGLVTGGASPVIRVNLNGLIVP